MTWGGESTRHEMCLSFLYVYPKTELKGCITQWTEEDYDEFWDTAVNKSWATQEDPDDHRTWFYDVSDPEADQYYRDFWTREERDYGCIGGGGNFWSGRITVPEFEEFPEPDYCAASEDGSSSDEGFVWDSWYGYTISIVVGLVAIALFVVMIRMCSKNRSNKDGYQEQLNDEENNNTTKPTKRSHSGEDKGVVALQPTSDGNKEYGATTY